ncbi:MAG: WG repeat-containing protein [Bacteroidetes bacterium]|nr:WG repeat-containing protein [Bacteroidota bacterium]
MLKSKLEKSFKLFLAVLVLIPINALAAKVFVPFKENRKYGYMDLDKNVIVKPAFDRTYIFKEEMGRFRYKDKYGYFNKSGQIVIKNVYSEAWDFKEGLAKIREGVRCGFIDKTGKQVIKVIGEDCSEFTNGFAIIKRMHKYGYINKDGAEIFEPVLTKAEPFENGMALIHIGSKYGLINETGNYILPPAYDFIGVSDGEYIRARIGGLWYIYNKKGEKLHTTSHIITTDCENGRFGFAKYETDMVQYKGYINPEGEEIVSPKYRWVGRFSGGLGVVNHEEKYGVINKDGQFVVEPQYQSTLGKYVEDRLGVKKDGKWGFIDPRGAKTVDFKYEDIQDYANGYAMVSQGFFKWGAVNMAGDLIVPMKYEIVLAEPEFLVAIIGELRAFYTFDGELLYKEVLPKE